MFRVASICSALRAELTRRELADHDVLISNPSPLTGERELYTVVSTDIDNAAGGPTVLVAEIETGTRYRTTAYATRDRLRRRTCAASSSVGSPTLSVIGSLSRSLPSCGAASWLGNRPSPG
jgi:hypothetical protein